MNKTLYIIRHGETDLNKRGIVQGRGVNSPLNETGLKQAAAFYRYYKDVPFDRVYTSTLLRTHQTVASFIEAGVPWTQLQGLDEIGWGNYEGLEQSAGLLEGFSAVTSAWAQGQLNVSVEGGETPLQVVERQNQAINTILSKEDDKVVLVCMHGRAMRILLCWLSGKPLREMDDFPHANTSLYKVHYSKGAFNIIDFYNLDHLKDSDLTVK
ncbi:probable phosphoglycerate mutase [bacterium A37T11]|nr:probable phosphoglycerate mutase [bacterium A37T11]